MEKNKSYLFNYIENWASENNYEITDLGAEFEGENFLVLKDDRNIIISFVLTGATSKGYIYTCIYMG